MSHGQSGKEVAYLDDLKEVPDLAVAGVNARDDAFKIWKAFCHLTESELILLVLHQFLDGVETEKHETVPLNPSTRLTDH